MPVSIRQTPTHPSKSQLLQPLLLKAMPAPYLDRPPTAAGSSLLPSSASIVCGSISVFAGQEEFLEGQPGLGPSVAPTSCLRTSETVLWESSSCGMGLPAILCQGSKAEQQPLSHHCQDCPALGSRLLGLSCPPTEPPSPAPGSLA